MPYLQLLAASEMVMIKTHLKALTIEIDSSYFEFI
jgi:hypothetical protein